MIVLGLRRSWRMEIGPKSTSGGPTLSCSLDEAGTVAIRHQTGKSKTCVWRWQERFMQEGVEGLLRDKTRPARKAPLEQATIERVVTLTQGPPPG